MVDLLGKADRFGLARGFIEEMNRRKLEIPSELFVRLLRRYFKHYNISGYRAFNWMEEYGCSLDKAAITFVIAMFVKKKQAVEAQSFFDKLKDICELDVVDYNKLIKGWCSVHKISKAARVFAEMKKTGIVPNVYTYNVFIDGLCRHCQITRAERVFTVMIEKGCQPNAASFNNFLSYYVKFGTTEKILEIYNQMKRFGCEPDVTTYNCLIACYCRDVENRDDAVKLIDEMVNKGIVP